MSFFPFIGMEDALKGIMKKINPLMKGVTHEIQLY